MSPNFRLSSLVYKLAPIGFAPLENRFRPAVDLSFSPILKEMFDANRVTDDVGQTHSLHSGLSAVNALALYRTVLERRPDTVIEIGMAYGVSTLTILSALSATNGKLISIDPFQQELWHGIGLRNVKRSGLSHHHEFMDSLDYLALPQLISGGRVIQMAYIDGMHTFDYVLLDVFLLDKLLAVGGVIGFNDCSYLSIAKVVRYLKTHRKYEELEIGLPTDPSLGHVVTALSELVYLDHKAARIKNLAERLRRSGQMISAGLSDNDRYFRKLENWEPDYDFYVPF